MINSNRQKSVQKSCNFQLNGENGKIKHWHITRKNRLSVRKYHTILPNDVCLHESTLSDIPYEYTTK